MWKKYGITLQIEGQFGASIPRKAEDIKKMLENRMPANPPDNYTPIDELAEIVKGEVGDSEESPFGWLTFKRDDKGLYYEGRCIRGHMKDSALQVAKFFEDTKNFRAKFVNRVYVLEQNISLGKVEIDGTEQRFIQVMTRLGPRSTIKYVDYVLSPKLHFILQVLDDNVITIEHLNSVFEYGSMHGIGAERSQGWGRYKYPIKIKEL